MSSTFYRKMCAEIESLEKQEQQSEKRYLVPSWELTQVNSYLIFEIHLSSPSSEVVTVNYITDDGTGVGDIDYEKASGELKFPPGCVLGVIRVKLLRAAVMDESKNFFIDLWGATGAYLAGIGNVVTLHTNRQNNRVKIERI